MPEKKKSPDSYDQFPLNTSRLQTKSRKDVIVSLSVMRFKIFEYLSSMVDHFRQSWPVTPIGPPSLKMIP